MWMCIKVVLQITLINLFDDVKGLLLYKIILVHLHDKLCNEAIGDKQINSDLRLQMIKKLAKRVYKLSNLGGENNKQVSITIEKCTQTIQRVSSLIHTNWQQIIKNSKSSTQIDLKNLTIHDLEHESPNLNKYYEKNNYKQAIVIKELPKLNRNYINAAFPYNYFEDEFSVIELYDFETWIWKNLNSNSNEFTEVCLAENIFSLFKTYLRAAKKFYVHDPLGYSRLILTSTKIVCVLDELATSEFPMLLEHKIGFDEKPLESLLLPNLNEIQLTLHLAKYITKRNRGCNPSLVSKCLCSSESFAVKYAQIDEQMQTTKQKILKQTAIDIEKKQLEVKAIVNLFETFNHAKCNSHNNSRQKRNCTNCSFKNFIVKKYEKPLPEEDLKRDAIMFELHIPAIIAILRESIHLLKETVLGFNCEKTEHIFGAWIDYSKIKEFSTSRHVFDVTLGSTVKLISDSHYSNINFFGNQGGSNFYYWCTASNRFIKNRTIEFDDYIVANGYNLKLCSRYQKKTISYDESKNIRKLCCFKLPTPYETLEWTLQGTEHTENQVLAAYKKCPKQLKIKEFIKFGCFRAGHCLQLRNLLDAFESKEISLEKLAICNLIAQALWQIGPLVCPYKEVATHQDLNNPTYLDYLCSVLNSTILYNKKNWKHSLILFNVIRICCRVISCSQANKTHDSIKLKFLKLIKE